jgi:hypothetical protein
MPRRFAPDELLNGLHYAFLDVTAQRLTDVQVLSGNLYRHYPRKTVESPFPTAFPGACRILSDRIFAKADNARLQPKFIRSSPRGAKLDRSSRGVKPSISPVPLYMILVITQ